MDRSMPGAEAEKSRYRHCRGILQTPVGLRHSGEVTGLLTKPDPPACGADDNAFATCPRRQQTSAKSASLARLLPVRPAVNQPSPN